MEFVKILNRCGRAVEITKIDWAATYKHIRVRREDVW